MLIGLVTKNGILIVEFANQKRVHGMPKMQAVVEAAAQRLRPILMTSLATSFGALPIALSLGASSTSRVPLGIVVVGGIIFSLILTLLVIPAVYTFLSSEHKTHTTEISE
jgi:multidrug efflux pump